MARVRTAVIPAAGLGTRSLPASKAVPKEMLTLVDRPAIQWVVEEAARSGIERVVIVIGRGKGPIQDHFDRHPELEAALGASGKDELLSMVKELSNLADISYVRQGEPKGLGHAVGVAEPVVGNEPFAVMLPDDVIHPTSTLLADMIAATEATDRSTLALLKIPGPEIATKGVAAVAGDLVTDVVEKPKHEDAPSDLAIIGRYVFTPALWPALTHVVAGALGELQLTDAIRELCAAGTVGYRVLESGYFDVGNHVDFLMAAVELALDHERVGPVFRTALTALVKEKGLL